MCVCEGVQKLETKHENKQLLEWNRVLVHSVQIILRLCMIWHYCRLVVLKGFDFLFKSFFLCFRWIVANCYLILMIFIVVISWFAGWSWVRSNALPRAGSLVWNCSVGTGCVKKKMNNERKDNVTFTEIFSSVQHKMRYLVEYLSYFLPYNESEWRPKL